MNTEKKPDTSKVDADSLVAYSKDRPQHRRCKNEFINIYEELIIVYVIL